MIHINRAIIPNLFTIGNLLCGFLALRYIAEGRYVPAAWLIVLGAALDNMDGRIARLMGRDSAFGIEFDSLADVCTFGVVPAFMLYHSLLSSAWGATLAFVFLLGGAFRLARYNVMSHEGRKSDYFTGLPIPAAAIALSQFIVFTEHSWETAHAAQLGVMVTMFLTVLMVSRVEYDSMPSFRSGGLWDRCKQVFFIGAVALIVYPTTSKDFFFPLVLAYLVTGVGRAVAGMFSDEAPQHA
ncbi:MAG: CDP-diacylglycerol--serine O-phosphatidyltransferase [bacterium]|nr:CDP-diacylglycerol--serine O-phosphatidyltransferase [bacterium]